MGVAAGAGSGAASGSVAGPVGAVIGAGIGAAASIFGSKKQSKSNDKATQMQAESNRQATELARQTEDNRRREFDQQQTELKRQWDIGEANKAPYRAASQGALLQLSDILGIAGLGAGSGGGSAAEPSGPVPPRPNDLVTAVAQANQLAYSGQDKHKNPSYWAADWAKDPDYTWKRMLGWQAGDGDVATSGLYAGKAGAGASKPVTAAAMPNAAPAASGNALAAPYAPAVKFRALYDPRMRA